MTDFYILLTRTSCFSYLSCSGWGCIVVFLPTFHVNLWFYSIFPACLVWIWIPVNESFFFSKDIWNTTWYPKAADHVNTDKTWYIVDATDKILGRLASTISIYIRGKNLATYTPSVDMGAFVIVVCGMYTYKLCILFFTMKWIILTTFICTWEWDCQGFDSHGPWFWWNSSIWSFIPPQPQSFLSSIFLN